MKAEQKFNLIKEYLHTSKIRLFENSITYNSTIEYIGTYGYTKYYEIIGTSSLTNLITKDVLTRGELSNLYYHAKRVDKNFKLYIKNKVLNMK